MYKSQYGSLEVLGMTLPILEPLIDGWFLVYHPNGAAMACSHTIAALGYAYDDVPQDVIVAGIRAFFGLAWPPLKAKLDAETAQ